MKVESWSISDVGRKRDHNEDSLWVDDALGLYVVADGMGGHEAGETASRIAAETVGAEVTRRVSNLPNVDANDRKTRQMFADGADPVISMLIESVQAASGAILDKTHEEPAYSGMGTTLTCLFVHSGRAWFAHVGDSRLYRLRRANFAQLSTDHSLVQEQLDAGLISKQEAETSQYKNIITRSVGFERSIQVDCESVDLAVGDIYLLCSDGLSNMVTDRELAEIISAKGPEVALKFFVNLANSRGGDDNITVLTVRISA